MNNEVFDITQYIRRYVRGELRVKEFENLIYSDDRLAEYFGSELYVEVISYDYRNSSDQDIKLKLNNFLNEFHPSLCACVTLSDTAILGMGEDSCSDAFKTIVEVKKRGEECWWLGLFQCSVCKQAWLVAAEPRINDLYCLGRMNEESFNLIMQSDTWPTMFDKFETLLVLGRKAGRSFRFIEPLVSPSLFWTIEDLLLERPEITISELSRLLNVSEDVVLHLKYENGRGIKMGDTESLDDADAFKWIRQVANNSNGKAQVYLGRMYEDGRGVEQNDVEAAKWYRLAAENGDVRGQANLGVMYLQGKGVAQDYTEALKWYRMAADSGDSHAQMCLGWMYKNGRGVEKDDTESINWYRKAAEEGNNESRKYLGSVYMKGAGVEQDEIEACKWYRLAAESGDAAAQYFLGWMYTHGRGVEQDDAKAARWYQLAADQGHENAEQALSLYH